MTVGQTREGSSMLWQRYQALSTFNYAFNKLLKAIRTLFDVLTADFSSLSERIKKELNSAESTLGSISVFVDITLIPEKVANIAHSLISAKKEAVILINELKGPNPIDKKHIPKILANLGKSLYYFTQLVTNFIFKPISFAAKYINLQELTTQLKNPAKIFSFIGYGAKVVRSLSEVALGKKVLLNLIFIALCVAFFVIGVLSFYYTIPSFVVIGLAGINAGIGLYKSWKKMRHLTDYQPSRSVIVN